METPPSQVTLTRTYAFAAAHYYYDPTLSDADNERVFGKCANRQGHGHNYRVEVWVRGTPDASTGMVIDLRRLDTTVQAAVIEPLDHRNLNTQVPWFATRQPTCENLAIWVYQALLPALPRGLLAAVRVHEADDLWAEVRAETPPAS